MTSVSVQCFEWDAEIIGYGVIRNKAEYLVAHLWVHLGKCSFILVDLCKTEGVGLVSPLISICAKNRSSHNILLYCCG